MNSAAGKCCFGAMKAGCPAADFAVFPYFSHVAADVSDGLIINYAADYTAYPPLKSLIQLDKGSRFAVFVKHVVTDGAVAAYRQARRDSAEMQRTVPQ